MNWLPELRVSNRLSFATGFFVAVWGLLVIVGWNSQNIRLTQVYSGWDPMAYDTALGLFLCGSGLAAASLGSWRVTLVASLLVAALAMLALVENLFRADLRVTEVLVPIAWEDAAFSGRMSQNAAGALFLTGLMLTTIGYGLLQKVEGYAFASMMGLLVALFGLLSLMTYFSTTGVEATGGQLIVMTPPAALGFTVLGLAAATYRWPEDAEESVDITRLQNVVITYVSAGVLVTMLFSVAIGLVPIYELILSDPFYEVVQAKLGGGDNTARSSHDHLASSLRRQVALTGIATLLLAYIGGFGVWRLLRPLTGRILMRAGALEKAVQKATGDLETNVKKLEHSNRQLDQFARVASHDLQSPVRNIVGFAELIRARHGAALGEPGRELLGFVTASAQQMQEQISGLLELSRLSSRAQPRVAVRTREVVSRVLEQLQGEIEQSGAQVHYGELPVVHGDRVQISLLFQNLISNSVKFRRSGVTPEITLSATREGDFWRFSVQDNGIGIDPVHREAVFEIFRRLHAQSAYSGSGIGLALCRDIVERHGGEILVEPAPGHGSLFRFTLPGVPDGVQASATGKSGNSK